MKNYMSGEKSCEGHAALKNEEQGFPPLKAIALKRLIQHQKLNISLP